MTRQKSELWEWIKALIIAILLAAIIRYFFFSPIVVEGTSMMPTLQNQDRMIVNKINYNIGDPKRFDIVVFHATKEKNYIKRVIGLPGDRIEYKEDTLYINGEPYNEPYLQQYKNELIDGPLTDPFIVDEVPEGELFVMGDNRRYSKDSRHIGTISIGEMIGNTNVVFWPIDDFGFVK